MSRARWRHPHSISSILATDRQGSILLSNDQPNRYTGYGDNSQSAARLGFTGQYCETNAGVYFFTQNGFTAVVNNDPASVKSIPSFIKGNRPVVQSYQSGKRVGNYELLELVPNKGSAEPIKDYERVPFRMSVERMAKASGVDVALINKPIALSELLDELDASGHVYTSVDCLHCRGNISSSRPSVFKNMYGAVLTQLDIRL